ncbi:MAG TPA: hypothetical protein VMV08_08315 [Gaiellaceae bacterium]|nr:hypothetical protein [Gaiellaceae bacterium]
MSTILVDPNDPVSWSSILTLAGPPKQVGGLLLYRIGATRTASPGC